MRSESRPRAWAIASCIPSGGLAVTSNSSGPSPGRIVSDGSIPNPPYLRKVPSSAIVMTVSRCICARVLGRLSATTQSTSPPANSREAKRSIPCGLVLSLRPTRIERLPRTRTSPPSMVAEPAAIPSLHSREPEKRGWKE